MAARKGKVKNQGKVLRGDSPDQRKRGLRNFQSGHFDSAIAVWEKLTLDPDLADAMAEARFRRALIRSNPSEQISDLKWALERNPNDLRYRYHLGLASHRLNELATAIECYRTVLQHEPAWDGAGMVLAVAELEQNPHVDLATLPGTTPAIRETLAPVQAILLGKVPAKQDGNNQKSNNLLETLRSSLGVEKHDKAMADFWIGLGLLQANDESANPDLLSTESLPSKEVAAIQSYYKGIADARQNNMKAAIEAWHHTLQQHTFEPAWLLGNLALALVNHIDEILAKEDLAKAESLANLLPKTSTSNAALDHMIVRTLNQIAHALAEKGEWKTAVGLWEHARDVANASSSLGSARPLLHNIALAYETLEDWIQAAETWRAMLRTKPRPKKTQKAASKTGGKKKQKTTAKQQEEQEEQPDTTPDDESVATTGLPSEAQWAWVRKRIIECYHQAGRPDEAVTIFRQAIKKDPDDLDMRMQFTAALIANDQEQAAQNELYRIIERDPNHIDALIRLATLHDQWGHWSHSQDMLERVIKLDPQREDVRREVAHLILVRGQREHQWGLYERASQTYRRGQQFDPENFVFPIQMARLAIEHGKLQEVPALLEEVLTIGADSHNAYALVIECWMAMNNVDKVRETLTRAESTISPTVDFYIEVGDIILQRIARAQRPPSPLGLFKQEPPPPQKPREVDLPWIAMANDILDRAAALEPENHRILFRIAAEIMTTAPEISLKYAEQGVELAPEEPYALITYGLVQAMNDQIQEAKKTLGRAIRIARKQGDMDMVRHAEDVRQQISDPFFRIAMSVGDIFGDPEDFDPFL